MLLGETARISCKMQVRYSAFVLLNELIVSFFEKRGRPHFLLLEHITTKFKIQESEKKSRVTSDLQTTLTNLTVSIFEKAI